MSASSKGDTAKTALIFAGGGSWPLVGSPYDFSRTSDRIGRVIKNTNASLAEHGLNKQSIPGELRPHSH